LTFAVVVISPPKYIHSRAFDEVAIGLNSSLRSLGHDSIIVRAESWTDLRTVGRRMIVLGAHLLGDLCLPRGTIIYNLEQIDSASAWLGPKVLGIYAQHEVWDYSERNASRYEAIGLKRPRVVPIGYAPELTRIEAASDQPIDVLFYGSVNDRRRVILEGLDARLNLEVIFGVYGEERDRLIAQSKIVLNLHYYDAQVFEIVRVSYLLANRVCVVSEWSPKLKTDWLPPGVAFTPYARLVDRCVELVWDGASRQSLAGAGFAAFSDRLQATFVQAALDASGPNR